jgi:hypothetical protein
VNTVVWKVKEIAEKTHGISNAVELQALIEEHCGVIVTVQTLRALRRSAPVAPRAELIQLLCDVLNCGSDTFSGFTPNPARARQWAKDRLEGKKPSPLYPTKSPQPVDEIVKAPHESVQSKSTGKPKSLSSTFTDPRLLFKTD